MHPKAARQPVARSRAALDFVGIGAARCGTSWLTRCLGEHPDVFIPDRKELKYFDNDFLYEPSLRLLRRHFAAAGPDQLRGEFSPRYMTSRIGLERLAAACPNVRIIVNLRHPVDRMFSDYCFFRFILKREPNGDFLSALAGPFGPSYIERSLYGKQMEHVLRLFPPHRVHVVLYDDIAERPLEVIESLFDFIEIDRRFIPPSCRRRVNRSDDGRRHAPRAAWARLGQWVSLGGSTLTRLARPIVMPAFSACGRLVDRCSILQENGSRPRLDPAVRDDLYEAYFREDLQQAERMVDLDLSAWTSHPTGEPESA